MGAGLYDCIPNESYQVSCAERADDSVRMVVIPQGTTMHVLSSSSVLIYPVS